MLTLKDVMALDMMKSAIVCTAEEQLAALVVDHLSVIEHPVEHYVQPQELILTSAVGTGSDPELFGSFVRDVIESPACGLVVAAGRHIRNIPRHVLDLADEHRFPIIQTPWDIRFADLIQAFLEEKQRWSGQPEVHAYVQQQQLLELFLNGEQLADLAESCRKKLNTPTVIMDKRGMIKGESKHTDTFTSKWTEDGWANRLPLGEEQHSDILPRTPVSDNRKWNALEKWAEDRVQLYAFEKRLLLLFDISASEQLYGYMMLILDGEDDLVPLINSKNRTFLEHAVTVAALWFVQEHSVFETEMRLRDDFVWSVANGEIETWDEILTRAKFFGYNMTLPYVCILGYPENLEALYAEEKTDTRSYLHWLQNMIHYVEDLFFETSSLMTAEMMVTYQKDVFLIYLEAEPPVQDKVHQFLDRIDRQLQHLLPDLIISWGISENQAGTRSFQDSFRDAGIALHIGRRQKGPGQRNMFGDTGVYRALLPVAHNEEMKHITWSTIGALIEYEKKRGIDLITTLMTYIRYQGNVSQTARALYLHRQSLLYRLRKIESLTQRSLQDPDDRFLLDLSIKVWMAGLVDPDD